MDPAILCITLAYGLIAGSFLNACIWRIPIQESLLPRSHCPQCGGKIAFYDNIPVISYLLLWGRCRYCRCRISWRYPAVEIGTAAFYVLLVWRFDLSFSLIPAVLFASMLIALIFIDLDHMILPDVITLPGILAGFLLSPLQDPIFFFDSFTSFLTAGWKPAGWIPYYTAYLGSFLGLAIGGGLLWAVAEIYFRVRKIEGLGFGDVKMMALVGAFIGWKYALLTIFLGSFSGAVIGLLYVRYKNLDFHRYQIPFGIFLGIAALVTLLTGPEILDWYFTLYD
jgi:leader peptidase (prepilin peptidase) / N-methyltransferase